MPIDPSDGGARTGLGPIETHGIDPTTATAMVRPDDLVFVEAADGDAEIVAAEYRGSAWLLTARLGSGATALVGTSHLRAPTVGAVGRVTLADGHHQVIVPD